MNNYFLTLSAKSIFAQTDLASIMSSSETQQVMKTYMNAYGAGSGSGGMFSWANIIAGLIFGSIGFVAFMYGKKQQSWRAMGIGIALMVYPYFVANAWALYGIGIALTAALYYWRE
jgi:hypothetical protein